MAALEFRVLGALEVLRDGKPLAVTAPKQRALLFLLLLRANQPVPQDTLIDDLWDANAPRTARASLQNHIHALRRTLGLGVLERQPAGYLLHVEPDRLDLHRFNRLVAEARRATTRERAAKLREALACWRGPALAEVRGAEFAETEIARLEEERLTALEDRIEADLELGRSVELVAELEELVARQPRRERFWTQLMLALYRSGRAADALAAYRRAHHTFTDELGIEPGVVLRELQRGILVQDPALDEPAQRLGSTLERATANLPRRARERAESLYEYGCALLRIGERRHAASTLEAAIRAAAAAREPGLEQRAKLSLSHLSIFVEGRTRAEHLAALDEAFAVFERLGDESGLAAACSERAYMLAAEGAVEHAAAWARRGIVVAVRAGDELGEAACRGKLAQCLATGTTPVDRAIAGCEEQLRAGCWNGGPFVVLEALAFLHAHAGRFDDARALQQRALDLIKTAGTAWHLVSGIFWAGMVERVAGNLDRAATHLRTAHAMLEAEDDRSFLGDTAGQLACVLAIRGDLEDSRRLARIARRVAQVDDHLVQALWRRALALVAAHEGQPDEAMRLCEEALALIRRSDWLTARGEALEEAAVIHELIGDDAAAKAALVEALRTYDQKGHLVGAQRVRERLFSS